MALFNILKRNRKYFAATKNGYKCKILIDENSESLENGEIMLAVDDISVRSKYGTDLIYRLSASAQQQSVADICTLRAPYNANLVSRCRELGGVWDSDQSAWIFPGFVADEIEKLDEKYNSEPTDIELEFNETASKREGPVCLAGFKLAESFGRDSGAKLEPGIAMISGGIASGGSRKNWKTVIRQGTRLRLTVPLDCVGDFDTSVVSIYVPGSRQMPDNLLELWSK